MGRVGEMEEILERKRKDAEKRENILESYGQNLKELELSFKSRDEEMINIKQQNN